MRKLFATQVLTFFSDFINSFYASENEGEQAPLLENTFQLENNHSNASYSEFVNKVMTLVEEAKKGNPYAIHSLNTINSRITPNSDYHTSMIKTQHLLNNTDPRVLKDFYSRQRFKNMTQRFDA